MTAVGLDIGSTWVKAVAIDEHGVQVATARRATPWRDCPGGATEMTAEDLMAAVDDMLAELCEGLGERTVAGIGVSGMAESGVLLDPSGRPARAIPAWFDPRGDAELRARPADLLAAFPEVTGLPVSALATAAKLHHHRAGGLELRGLTWLDVPEYVAHRLGGERLGETSLQARTGLLDQDTGAAWLPMLADLGADADLLAPTARAGEVWGRASAVPGPLRGAALSVAGHDHLVAGLAAGAVGPHQLYDSMGTAEALVRIVPGTLPGATRGELATSGVNVVRHLLPDHSVLLAGTRGGLILRRVLSMVGVHDAATREALDALVMQRPAGAVEGIVVSGAVNTSSRLHLTVEADEVSPARVFATALAHTTDVLREVVAVIDDHVGPATETVVAGGWTQMASVRRARRDVLPGVRFSARADDTAYGAALVGAFAAEPGEHDLADYVRRRLDEPVPTQPAPVP